MSYKPVSEKIIFLTECRLLTYKSKMVVRLKENTEYDANKMQISFNLQYTLLKIRHSTIMQTNDYIIANLPV